MTGLVPIPIILTNSVGTRMELLVVSILVKYESSFPSCSTSWTISSVQNVHTVMNTQLRMVQLRESLGPVEVKHVYIVTLFI